MVPHAYRIVYLIRYDRSQSPCNNHTIAAAMTTVDGQGPMTHTNNEAKQSVWCRMLFFLTYSSFIFHSCRLFSILLDSQIHGADHLQQWPLRTPARRKHHSTQMNVCALWYNGNLCSRPRVDTARFFLSFYLSLERCAGAATHLCEYVCDRAHSIVCATAMARLRRRPEFNVEHIL